MQLQISLQIRVKNDVIDIYIYSGCEITVGYRTCPTNLAQCPIEKRFFLLNVRTMSDENLIVVKP